MRKHWIWLAALSVVVLAALALWSRRPAKDSEGAGGPSDAERQRIKGFWSAYNQAGVLRQKGDWKGAARNYRECLDFNPKHEESLYYLAVSQEELGDYEEAVATLRRMLEVNPESGRALSQLGSVLATLAPGAPADLGEARRVYQRNVEVNREQAGPFLRLGLLDLNQAQLGAALEHFHTAAGFGAPEGNFWVAYTLCLLRQYPESAAYFRKVLDSYSRERKLAGKGIKAEGDVLPDPAKPMTALERAGVKSLLLTRWLEGREGGAPSSAFAPVRGVPADGGRAAWGDFDGDGALDLLIAGLGRPVTLLKNHGGGFVDATRAAGLAGISDVWDAVWVDYDLDRRLDLYLIRRGHTGRGQNLLYHNRGNGTFSDVTTASGLAGERVTARALFFDYNGDGKPDLLEAGAGLRLYRNDGGRWTDQTAPAGLSLAGSVVDAAAGDFNRDGKPDLFVVRWLKDAVLYLNRDGSFADSTEAAGLNGLRGRSFGAVALDFDKDRQLDLLLTAHAAFEDSARSLLQPDFKALRGTPRLFRNRGDGRFDEVTAQAGLARAFGTMQAVAADFDADGYPDLLLANGSLDAHRLESSVILRNLNGKEFRQWQQLPGAGRPANHLGAAVADFNQDGLPDIYLASNPLVRSGGGLFENRSGVKVSALR